MSLGTAATCAAELPSIAGEGSRDVEAEAAALSLARRRGKSTPSVDTKLADAWLGFYVALTKSSSRSTEAATQASTEWTEASLSEVASEPDDIASEPATASTLRESWADLSEEPSPKKRSRRSQRRRRTRGRGRRGRKAAAGDGPEDECTPIDEEEDQANSNCHLEPCTMPTAAPAPAAGRFIQPPAVLPSDCIPSSSPSKAFKGFACLTSTSPNAVSTPVRVEASARTPPRVAFGGSPMACMMPQPLAPTAFGALSFSGCNGGYQSSPVMLASSPVAVGMASCPPTFFASAITAPPPTPASPGLCTTPMAASPLNNPPPEDAMRAWLAGGVSANDMDLAMRLQAAAPEAYED